MGARATAASTKVINADKKKVAQNFLDNINSVIAVLTKAEADALTA